MIIEGILVVTGQSKDLYSPIYFANVAHLLYFLKSASGPVYFYGYRKEKSTADLYVVNRIPTVTSMTKMGAGVQNADNWVIDGDHIEYKVKYDDSWSVKRPPFPPEEGWVGEDITIDMHNLLNRCVAAYDHAAPVYYSINQDTRFSTKWVEKPNVLRICDARHILHPESCLVFLNGFCVDAESDYDEELGTCLKLPNVDGVCNNTQDRSRGCIVVDFGLNMDLTKTKLSSFTGTLSSGLVLGSSFDLKNKSYLLSLDGRLFLPDEFFLYQSGGSTVLEFNVAKYFTDASLLDKKVCLGDFVRNTRNLVIEKPDNQNTWLTHLDTYLRNSSNSFLITIPKPGIKVIKHLASSVVNKNQLSGPTQAGTASLNTVEFKGGSRGLVIDLNTRSVYEQHQQQANQSFVMESKKVSISRPVYWDREIIRLEPATPVKLWLQNDNHMSTYASMHDCNVLSGNEQVLWPRYAMLDIIFVS